MSIIDDQAIEFSNTMRAKAELMRKVKYEFDAIIAEWFGGVNALFPNESDNMIEDGRNTETSLSGADMNSLITRMISFQSVLDADSEMLVVHKACVRTLEVN